MLDFLPLLPCRRRFENTGPIPQSESLDIECGEVINKVGRKLEFIQQPLRARNLEPRCTQERCWATERVVFDSNDYLRGSPRNLFTTFEAVAGLIMCV